MSETVITNSLNLMTVLRGLDPLTYAPIGRNVTLSGALDPKCFQGGNRLPTPK